MKASNVCVAAMLALLSELVGCHSQQSNTESHGILESSKQKPNDTIPNDLEQRGKILRKDLEQTYKRLTDTRAISSFPNGTDISDVLLAHIPIGTSFDDAESILRNAGFNVGPRHPSDFKENSSLDAYGVGADLEYLNGRLALNARVLVLLIPPAVNNYSKVYRISAHILEVLP